jgi:putative protease
MNKCETEIFIHGAMCVSISGRCLLGVYLAQRHPNQGDCPQPCRYIYDISLSKDHPGELKERFTAEEDSQGVYLFNSKDLNTLSILPEIMESGVNSLKIEGRNKSVHYVSSVVKIYRAAIDRYFENQLDYAPDDIWFDELNALDHRPYTTGFYKNDYCMQEYSFSKEQSKVRLVGMVKAVLKGGNAVIDVKNPFSAHERLHVFPVSKKVDQYSIEFSEIKDLNSNSLERALTNHLVQVDKKYKLSVGDIIRRNIFK